MRTLKGFFTTTLTTRAFLGGILRIDFHEGCADLSSLVLQMILSYPIPVPELAIQPALALTFLPGFSTCPCMPISSCFLICKASYCNASHNH